MAGENVGNAYVAVVPRVDGSASAVGNEIGAKLSGGMKRPFGAGAVALGNILSNTLERAASFAGEQLAKAFWNYADYEQLVGGVDTLFKDSSAVVQENARAAFETAGMSANEYMENVTSFSASLIQSLDGDTAKAAQIADKAIIDMSDNANKMGTDMESITNAYQGFAKQNYTMLDNLKLGYNGTKSEMERLLADASKIAGVEFNIDSYSDVIEAIHVMQEEMGIAGTTAEESASTISGSLNTLSGAWDNWLTSLAADEMDVKETTKKLVDAATNVIRNAIPAIRLILESIGELVMEGLGEIIGPENAEALRAGLVEAFEKFKEVASDAGEAISYLWNDVLAPFGSWLSDVFGPILDDIIEKMGGIGGVIDAINQAIAPGSGITKFTKDFSDSEKVMSASANKMVSAVSGSFSRMTKSAENSASTVKRSMDYSPLSSKVGTQFKTAASSMEAPIKKAVKTITAAPSTITTKYSGLGSKISSAFGSIKFPQPHITYSEVEVLGKTIRMPKVSWYARGGIVDGATLIGAGERGAELIWPSYEPYIGKYARAIADSMPDSGVTVNFTYNGREDASGAVKLLTANLRQLKATGAI